MWLSQNKITTLFLCLSSYVFSQTVLVQDAVFANGLCDRLPLAMDAGCTLLDTVKAETEYKDGVQELRLANRNITNADEVVYFKNIDSIRLNNNEIIEFPQDISRFRSLGRLNLNFNLLTTAPDILYTNTVGVDTAVKLFYIIGNKVSNLPDSWYLPNPFTQVVDLYRNELEEIPTFADYSQIRRIDIRENRLGFEDLIPVKGNPLYGIQQFDLFPQKEFPLVIDTLVEIGETIRFDVSTGLASNTYTLLKDNNNFITNSTGIFEITVNSASDLGSFWVKTRNSNFPDTSDFLKTVTATIKIKEPEEEISSNVVKEKDVFVFSPDGDGNFDELLIQGEGEANFYNTAGIKVRMEQLPFLWKGDKKNGQQAEPGLYLIEKENGEAVKIFITY